MIKSTILLAVSLVGFLVAPLSVPQKPSQRVINVPLQVIVSDSVPAPLPHQRAAEVVVSVPKAKALPSVPKKDKKLMCTAYEQSLAGGSYRRCEWK
jgi:hypothetical protein